MLLRELLALRAPQANVDSELAARLVSRVGGLPLGIRLVADLSRSVPPADVLSQTISTLVTEIEPALEAVLPRSVRRVVMRSRRRRSWQARWTPPLIASLVGVDDVDAVLSQLCENGLLQFDDQRPDAPYSMLEPLRDVAGRMLDASDRRPAVSEDWSTSVCTARSRYARQMRSVEDGYPLRVRLDRELPWHRQAIQHLATRR